MNAADISALLAQKGQTVTIAGQTDSAYDPSTSGVSGGTPYSASASAVLLPMTPYRAMKGTDIIDGDENLLLSATIDQPPVGAIVTLADGTTKYKLVSINPLHPAGSELLFDCVVRK